MAIDVNGILKSSNNTVRISVDKLIAILEKAHAQASKDEPIAEKKFRAEIKKYRADLANYYRARAKATARVTITDDMDSSWDFSRKIDTMVPERREPSFPKAPKRGVAENIRYVIDGLKTRAAGEKLVSVRLGELEKYIEVAKSPIECRC